MSCSLRWENKSHEFLMKPKIFLCGLTKDHQSLPLLIPTTTTGYFNEVMCRPDKGDLAKQYPCALFVVGSYLCAVDEWFPIIAHMYI